LASTGEPDPFILLNLAFSTQETYTSEVRTTPDGQSDTSWAGDKGQAAASQPSAVRLVHVNAADVLVRRGIDGTASDIRLFRASLRRPGQAAVCAGGPSGNGPRASDLNSKTGEKSPDRGVHADDDA
jgi:hypothetical protein